MKALTKHNVFCFKVHGGPFMMAGLPDIIACVDGKFIGLETKMPDGAGPSQIQVMVHGMIKHAGGQATVVRSVAQALAACGLKA